MTEKSGSAVPFAAAARLPTKISNFSFGVAKRNKAENGTDCTGAAFASSVGGVTVFPAASFVSPFTVVPFASLNEDPFASKRDSFESGADD